MGPFGAALRLKTVGPPQPVLQTIEVAGNNLEVVGKCQRVFHICWDASLRIGFGTSLLDQHVNPPLGFVEWKDECKIQAGKARFLVKLLPGDKYNFTLTPQLKRVTRPFIFDLLKFNEAARANVVYDSTVTAERRLKAGSDRLECAAIRIETTSHPKEDESTGHKPKGCDQKCRRIGSDNRHRPQNDDRENTGP